MSAATRAALAMCLLPLVAAALPATAGDAPPATQQAHVHAHSHEVMPFDIASVEHVFRMSETGGSMRVVLRDGADTVQLAPIRTHLREQAERFGAGDFGAPSHLHGPGMPGLAELQAGAARVRVVYAELPDGAEIRFEADEPGLVTAVHRWFGAQLSEHGADARAE